MRTRSRLLSATACALALTTAIAGCGGDDDDSDSDDAAPTSGLAAVCPETIVVQTGWFPEAEYGPLFQLAGPDGEVDGESGSYTGEIGDTGVMLEIRAGGPFLGNTQASAQMYLDDEITFGLIDSDEAIENIEEAPTVSVLSYMNVPPQAIIFDPETYDFDEIADVGESDATVLVFEGSTYQRWLIGAGLIREDQMDGSYTGAPDQFVASEGAAVLGSGYATLEPYTFAELPAWGQELEAMLLYDAGYPIYGSSLAVRADRVEELSDCLTEIVPMFQQSTADYLESPDDVHAILAELNEAIGDFWQTPVEQSEYAHSRLIELGTFSDGAGGYFGQFEPERMQDILDVVVPILEETGSDVPDDIAWEDFATDEFLDTSISTAGAGE